MAISTACRIDAVGERVGVADPPAGGEDADHGELEDADVRRRDGNDRGDVDGEEHRGGGADPGLAVEAERGEQRPAGAELDRPGAELRRRRRAVPDAGRGRPRGRPGPGSAPGAARRPASPAGRCRCAGSASGRRAGRAAATSGTKLKAKIFWVLEWKSGVVETMITPSRTRATMLSSVCETSVPMITGNVSRMRPVRRESESARAGSPSRAGRVADISTPIIVAEVTSRRRTGRLGSAAPTIQYQEAARKKRERAIRAEGDQDPGHVGVGRCSRRRCRRRSCARRAAVRPTPSSAGDAEADPARDPAPATAALGERRIERGQPLRGAPADRRRRAGRPAQCGEPFARS